MKEAFSLIGLIAFFALIFPLASLLLTTPLFKSLRVAKLVTVERSVPLLDKNGEAVLDENGNQQMTTETETVWEGANKPVLPKPL